MPYRCVYQTWQFVQPRITCTQVSAENTCIVEEKRFVIQKGRIGKRLSLSQLALKVGVDTETLAAYERGDGVLSDAIVTQLQKVVSKDSE